MARRPGPLDLQWRKDLDFFTGNDQKTWTLSMAIARRPGPPRRQWREDCVVFKMCYTARTEKRQEKKERKQRKKEGPSILTPRLEPRPDYNVLSFSLRLAPRGSLTPGMIPFKSLKAQTGWVPLPQWTRSPMPVFYRSNAIGCLSGTFH